MTVLETLVPGHKPQPLYSCDLRSVTREVAGSSPVAPVETSCKSALVVVSCGAVDRRLSDRSRARKSALKTGKDGRAGVPFEDPLGRRQPRAVGWLPGRALTHYSLVVREDARTRRPCCQRSDRVSSPRSYAARSGRRSTAQPPPWPRRAFSAPSRALLLRRRRRATRRRSAWGSRSTGRGSGRGHRPAPRG